MQNERIFTAVTAYTILVSPVSVPEGLFCSSVLNTVGGVGWGGKQGRFILSGTVGEQKPVAHLAIEPSFLLGKFLSRDRFWSLRSLVRFI